MSLALKQQQQLEVIENETISCINCKHCAELDRFPAMRCDLHNRPVNYENRCTGYELEV